MSTEILRSARVYAALEPISELNRSTEYLLMWYIAILDYPNDSSISLNVAASMAMSHGLLGRLPRH